MKILNFGSLNIDHVYRVDEFVRPGETKATKSLMVNCGGKGLNQSIAAAKAGCEVFHAGLLGCNGNALREQLESNGVNISFLAPSPAFSGSAIIEVTDHGQNRILLYGGTNRMLTEKQIRDTLDSIGPDTLVLLQNETNLVGFIIDEAAKRGLKTALNAAPMNADVLTYPLEKLSYLIVNEVEGAGIAGTSEPADAFDILCKKFPDVCILLTLGADGALCRKGPEKLSIGTCRVKPVDTTAAGDCFTGYFLYGELNGLPLGKTLQFATAASALCVQKPGASDSVPTLSEVHDALSTLAAPEAKPL